MSWGNAEHRVMSLNRSLLRIVAAALGPIAVGLADAPRADAQVGDSASTCTGTVYDDVDVDGARDQHEVGLAGVDVVITDRGGRQVTAATDAEGRWSADLATDHYPVRLEFETPAGHRASRAGDSNGTAVQFVNHPSGCDGPTGSFAVYTPGSACRSEQVLVTGCATPGDVDGDGVHAAAIQLVSTATVDDASSDGESPADWLSPAPTAVVDAQGIGSIHGLATDHRRTIYAAGFVKRHVPTASDIDPSGNPTSIYRVRPGRTPDVLVTIDPDAADPHGDVDDWRVDTAAFDDVFTAGLGDLEATPDGRHLFTVDLGRRELVAVALPRGEIVHRLPLTGELLGISDCGVGDDTPFGDLRPFGLGIDAGDRLLLGLVCSAESTVAPGDVIDERETPDRALGDPDQLVGHVVEFDLATFDAAMPGWSRRPVRRLSWPLAIDRGDTHANGLVSNDATWHPWVSGVPFVDEHDVVSYPQPAITDLAVDADGTLLIALGDRWGHQTLADTEAPTTDGRTYDITETAQAGDLQRACPVDDGWVIEGTADCDGGWGNGFEFFDGESYGWYAETALGSVIVLPDNPDDADEASSVVVVSQMNPIPGRDSWRSAGLGWHDARSGDVIRGARLYDGRHADPDGTFEEASGIADLALLCDWAAIEIGGRLWYDADGDGEQDPAEPSLTGVDVELRDTAGRILATAATAGDGRYSFDSDDVDGEMLDGDEYLVTVADRNFATGPFGRHGEYVGLRPSPRAATVSHLDSNARIGTATGPVAGFSVARVVVGDDPETDDVEGVADHTIDFGYRDQYDLAIATRSVRDRDTLGILAFETVIHNQGSEASGAFVVTARLPPGTSLIAASRGATPTRPGGSELRWSFHEGESLAAGAVRRLTTLVFVDDPTQSPFVHAVQITAANGTDDDSVPGDARFDVVTDRTDAFRSDGTLIDDNGGFPEQDDADIAVVHLHEISGRIWIDADRDATYEPDDPSDGGGPGELAAAGVTVILRHRDGTVIEQQWTNHEGLYQFTMVPSDEYVIDIPPDEFRAGRPLGGYEWMQSPYRTGGFDADAGLRLPLTLQPGVDGSTRVVDIAVAEPHGTPLLDHARIELLLPALAALAVATLVWQRRSNRSVAVAG